MNKKAFFGLADQYNNIVTTNRRLRRMVELSAKADRSFLGLSLTPEELTELDEAAKDVATRTRSMASYPLTRFLLPDKKLDDVATATDSVSSKIRGAVNKARFVDTALRWGLTGFGAVKGYRVGSKLFSKNKLLAGMLGGALGAGAGYGTYRVMKHLAEKEWTL